MDKLFAVLKSRKFWAALAGLAVVLFGERGNIPTADLMAAVGVLAAYIIGTSLEDGLRAK